MRPPVTRHDLGIARHAPSIDPVAEAGRWFDRELAGGQVPPLLVVIGLGDGHLLEALERRSIETRVLALEPDPQVARGFLARRDWSGWLDSGRLVYLVDPDYAGSDQAWRIFPSTSSGHKVLVHPTVASGGQPGAVRAARALKQIVFGARANAEARSRFAPRYLTNTIRNLPALAGGSDVRALANAFHGMPAIVVGAGPSLDGAVADLRAAADRAVLIASDTALRPLLNAGLEPHLVVAVDPGAANARHFQALPECRQTWLVGESALDRGVTEAFGDRTFWFRVADHHPWPWLNRLGIDAGRLDVWGSVLTAAFEVALTAGCDPIVLVGADLAFTGERPYCRGTTYEFDWAYWTARGQALERAWQEQMARSEPIRARDLRGGETTTSSILQSFSEWMVRRAARSGRRVVNATGAGIFFGDGVEQASLSDVLPPSGAVAPLKTMARAASSKAAARSDLAARLRTLRETIETAGPPAPPLTQWMEFSGEGYDAGALGAAIDDAVHRIEERSSASSRRTEPGDPWAALACADIERGLMGELPEALARLRAALGGEPLPPLPQAHGVGPEERAALLIRAFDLLDRLSAALQPGGDLTAGSATVNEPGGAESHDGRGRPVWPESVKWAVQLCEALLGKVWRTPLRTVDASLDLKPVSLGDLATTPEALGQACALLALEWALAARHAADAAPDHERCVRRLLGLVALLQRAGQPDGHDEAAALLLDVHAAGRRGTRELPLPFSRASLARVLTGMVLVSADQQASLDILLPRAARPGTVVLPLGRVDLAGLSVSLVLRLGGCSPGSADTPRADHAVPAGGGPAHISAPEPRFVVPRVLTNEGLPRSVVAYATRDGAVCVPFHETASLLVLEDGSVTPHRHWPRPIFGELPMGADGTVAWSNGTASWSQTETGYVMYQTCADGPVTIEEVPFRPTAGTWFRGRLYWAGFPSGVCSWAPGEAPAFAFPDLSLFNVRATPTGLLLDPCVRGADGLLRRRLLDHGWRWDARGEPEAIALGPCGAASSWSSACGWTAVAHPVADVVRLESAGRSDRFLTCYYPTCLAWVGRSLLVSNVTGELFLFERLVDALEGDS